MKHKKALLGLVVALVLVSCVVAGLLTYRLRTSYKIKAFISPVVKTIDLGDMYADADAQNYTFSGTWGQYKAWQNNTLVTVALQNVGTLSTDFTAFILTLTFGSEGSVTVDLASTSGNITVSLWGSVTYAINCMTLANGGTEVTRTNLVVVEVSVTKP